jgi:hypothetical protein
MSIAPDGFPWHGPPLDEPLLNCPPIFTTKNWFVAVTALADVAAIFCDEAGGRTLDAFCGPPLEHAASAKAIKKQTVR